MFDNLYIGHSLEDAQKLAEQTFEVKKMIEGDVKKAEDKAEAEEAGDVQTAFKDDPIGFVRGKVFEFVDLAKIDLSFAIRAMPEVAAGLGFVALFFVGAVFSLLFGGSSPKPAAVSVYVSTAVCYQILNIHLLPEEVIQEDRCPHTR